MHYQELFLHGAEKTTPILSINLQNQIPLAKNCGRIQSNLPSFIFRQLNKNTNSF